MTIPFPLTRLLACGLILSAIPALAATRVVTITAPVEVRSGEKISVLIAASTDLPDGERIGFLHSEYSVDGGKTWTSFMFEEKLGRTATRTLGLEAGAAGTKVIVRARVAFRGGAAGDVDFKGGAIQWGTTWEKWLTPPARSQIIYVR
jgi:hypothetical protein